MLVTDAQREVRTVYLGGSIGQIVSGAIWLVSAALATSIGARLGIITLVAGGMFIFPLTQLVLRVMRRPSTLSAENPLKHLAMQIAFTVPLVLPVVGGAALYNINWFYPGCLVVVGAHYMPFVFLYGMRLYVLLAAVLMGVGLMLAFFGAVQFSIGGWIGGGVLVGFGLVATKIRR